MNGKTNALLPIIGADLTVSVPAGVTVTVSKDGKSKPSKVATNGSVTFRNLEEGEWTITISDGVNAVSKKIQIKTNYSVDVRPKITLYIDYPVNSICTISKDDISIDAPDTSGHWECIIHELGTWTIIAPYDDGEWTIDLTEKVQASNNGQVFVVEMIPARSTKTLFAIKSNVEDFLGISKQFIPDSHTPIIKSDSEFIITNDSDSDMCIFMDKIITGICLNKVYAQTRLVKDPDLGYTYGSLIIAPEATYNTIEEIQQAILVRQDHLPLTNPNSDDGHNAVSIAEENLPNIPVTGAKVGIIIPSKARINLEQLRIEYYGGLSLDM